MCHLEAAATRSRPMCPRRSRCLPPYPFYASPPLLPRPDGGGSPSEPPVHVSSGGHTFEARRDRGSESAGPAFLPFQESILRLFDRDRAAGRLCSTRRAMDRQPESPVGAKGRRAGPAYSSIHPLIVTSVIQAYRLTADGQLDGRTDGRTERRSGCCRPTDRSAAVTDGPMCGRIDGDGTEGFRGRGRDLRLTKDAICNSRGIGG